MNDDATKRRAEHTDATIDRKALAAWLRGFADSRLRGLFGFDEVHCAANLLQADADEIERLRADRERLIEFVKWLATADYMDEIEVLEQARKVYREVKREAANA